MSFSMDRLYPKDTKFDAEMLEAEMLDNKKKSVDYKIEKAVEGILMTSQENDVDKHFLLDIQKL